MKLFLLSIFIFISSCAKKLEYNSILVVEDHSGNMLLRDERVAIDRSDPHNSRIILSRNGSGQIKEITRVMLGKEIILSIDGMKFNSMIVSSIIENGIISIQNMDSGVEYNAENKAVNGLLPNK